MQATAKKYKKKGKFNGEPPSAWRRERKGRNQQNEERGWQHQTELEEKIDENSETYANIDQTRGSPVFGTKRGMRRTPRSPPTRRKASERITASQFKGGRERERFRTELFSDILCHNTCAKKKTIEHSKRGKKRKLVSRRRPR